MTEYESVIQKGRATKAEERRERAVLVGVDRPGPAVAAWHRRLPSWSVWSTRPGADVVAIDHPEARTRRTRARSSARARPRRLPSWHASHAADLVVFDDELTPSQQANLEKVSRTST